MHERPEYSGWACKITSYLLWVEFGHSLSAKKAFRHKQVPLVTDLADGYLISCNFDSKYTRSSAACKRNLWAAPDQLIR